MRNDLEGASVLGGAAAGLSYDGARCDALARDQVARRIGPGVLAIARDQAKSTVSKPLSHTIATPSE